MAHFAPMGSGGPDESPTRAVSQLALPASLRTGRLQLFRQPPASPVAAIDSRDKQRTATCRRDQAFSCGRCPSLQMIATEKQRRDRYGVLYLLLPVRSVPSGTQKTTLNLPDALHAEASDAGKQAGNDLGPVAEVGRVISCCCVRFSRRID